MFGLFQKKKQPATGKLAELGHGYVGKTQLRPDFLKLNVCSRESISLDHWVQDGFTMSVRGHGGEKAHEFEAATSLFFMAGNQDELSLLGVIQPSLDSCQRYYPFVSFIHCTQAVYKKHPACLFLGAQPVMDRLFDITAELFHANRLEQMAEEAQELRQVTKGVNIPLDLHQQINKFRQVPMSWLWQGIELATTPTRAAFIHQSSQILSAMASRGCRKNHLGVRFPLSSVKGEWALMAAFWLHLMTMRVADPHWRPWLFCHQSTDGQPASMTVFTRPVAASSFEGIWSPRLTTPGIIDIDLFAPRGAPSDAASQLASLDNMSMYDALRRWCKC